MVRIARRFWRHKFASRQPNSIKEKVRVNASCALIYQLDFLFDLFSTCQYSKKSF